MFKLAGDGTDQEKFNLLEELLKGSPAQTFPEVPSNEPPTVTSSVQAPLVSTLPTAEAPSASPEVPSFTADRQSRLDELRAAQIAQNDMNRIAAGTNLAVQGLKAQGTDADTSAVKMIQEQARQPVTMLGQQRAAEMEEFKRAGLLREEDLRKQKDDPNSEISKNAAKALQESFKLIGYTNTEPFKNLSLTQIEANPMLKAMMDSATRKYAADEAAKARREMIAQSGERLSQKQEQQQQKEFTDITNKARQAIKKDADKLTTANESMNRIRMALAAPGGVVEYSAVVPFIKSLDDSVVREGEFRNFMDTTGILNTWQGKAKKLFRRQGGLVSKEVLNQMADIMDNTLVGGVSNMKAKLEPFKQEAKDKGLDEDTFFRRTLPAYTPSKPASSGKAIAKKQYSPSANKTKLIYTDGTEEILDGRQ